ncbi:MAG: hypothetical protein ACRDA7_00455 [Metamycoplasmataceae bacterium]
MDNINEILKKWVPFFPKKEKYLNRLIKKNISEHHEFFKRLSFNNDFLYGEKGLGYGKFNILTIRAICLALIKELRKNQEENIDILLVSDKEENDFFLKEFVKVLSFNKCEGTIFKNYTPFDKKFAKKTMKKLNIKNLVFIETNEYDNKIINLFIINEEKNINIKNIINEINQLDLFDIEIDENANPSILSNTKVITEYVNTILKIKTRENDQKNLRVAIACNNSGTGEILKKIFGNMDYFYVYKKYKKHQKLNMNKPNLEKRVFWKEIIFAKKNKCDLLICSPDNSSKLFLFSTEKRSLIYFDNYLFPLFFLNIFIPELKRNNVNLNKIFVASDIPASPSIDKLINKYNIKFFVDNVPILRTNENLLFYWNDNKFVFGDDKLIETSFHHILIKLSEIINYLKTQNSNINVELKKISRIYGNSFRNYFFFKIEKEKIINYFSIKENENKFKKVKRNLIVNESDIDEVTLFKIVDINEEYNIYIKYHFSLKQAVFIFTSNYIEETKKKKLFSSISNYNKYLKIAKLLFKDINNHYFDK